MQPILENEYMLIGIPFASIRNLTKRAYPLTNPTTFTLSLTFTSIVFNALMSPSRHPRSEGLLLHKISLDSAGCEDHNPCISRILVILDPSLATNLNQISMSNIILGPMFPAK